MKSSKKIALIIAIIIISVVLIYALSLLLIYFSETERIMRKAVKNNDESLCNNIKISEFGELFDRYFCIAGVQKSDSFCNNLNTTKKWEEKFYTGFLLFSNIEAGNKTIKHNKDQCYFAAALRLKNKNICDKIETTEEHLDKEYCKEIFEKFS